MKKVGRATPSMKTAAKPAHPRGAGRRRGESTPPPDGPGPRRHHRRRGGPSPEIGNILGLPRGPPMPRRRVNCAGAGQPHCLRGCPQTGRPLAGPTSHSCIASLRARAPLQKTDCHALADLCPVKRATPARTLAPTLRIEWASHCRGLRGPLQQRRPPFRGARCRPTRCRPRGAWAIGAGTAAPRRCSVAAQHRRDPWRAAAELPEPA